MKKYHRLSVYLSTFMLALLLAPWSTFVPESMAQQDNDTTYVIGPSDVLEVLVWRNEDLTRTVTVRPDGKITLPLLDEMNASGLTASQLKHAIHLKLRSFMDDPEVNVIVTEVNSKVVYVQGQVTAPGAYVMNKELDLMQLISMAGGFTEFAKIKNIKIMRKREEGIETIKANYKKITNGKDPGQNVALKPGDTIIVP
ncbi:polysaccharide biosynthesis/export family protein [Thermodesulfobacteriota bacterium]